MDFCKSLVGTLNTLKGQVGSFQSNYEEIRGLILGEFQACKEDFENNNLDADLVSNFIKISKLLEVLLLFDISKEEKEKFINMS